MYMRNLIRSTHKSSRVLFVVIVLATLVASVALPYSASAATTYYVNDDATGANNGSSWTDAFTSLQSALQAATSPGDEIYVAAGTYYPGTARNETFRVQDGVAVYGGYIGTGPEPNLRDFELYETILSGEIGDPGDVADNTFHVVTVMNTGSSLTRVDGFTITGGMANDTGTYGPAGGGMLLEYALVTLENLVFNGNTGNVKGGGITSGFGNVTINNVTFNNNHASQGGGMYVFETLLTMEEVTFINNVANDRGGGLYLYNLPTSAIVTSTLFDNNEARSGGGGGLYVDRGSPAISNSTFSFNEANTGSNASGGGFTVGSDSTPTFTNVTVNDNYAIHNAGGAMIMGAAILNDVDFIHNSTDASGGGMQVYDASPTLTNVRFIDNSAMNMGGALSHSFEAGAVLRNVLFNGNSTELGGGGAVEVNGPLSHPIFVNSTFVNNSSTSTAPGGAILAHDGGPSARTIIVNSIFRGNVSNSGGTPVLDQITVNAGTNLVATYSDIQGGFTGDGNVDVDPLFLDMDGEDEIAGNVDDNLQLHWTSPVIDQGNNALVISNALTQDLAGQARRVDMLNVADVAGQTAPVVDMGVYEAQAPELVVTKTIATSPADEGETVTYTLTVANQGVGTAHAVVISDPLPAGLTLVGLPEISPEGAGTFGSPAILAENITLETSETVTVTYQASGLDGPDIINNTVTVTATEIPAPGVTATAALAVDNAAPTVNAGDDRTIPEGTTVNFTGSFNDPAGTLDNPYTIAWDFGGGSVANTLSASHLYGDDGTFNAVLSVTDGDSATGSDTAVITVTNVAPAVTAGDDQTALEGQLLSFSGSATDPGSNENLVYSWNFGDGGTATGQTPTHEYADNGTFTVTLTVTDKDGASGQDTLTVTVSNVSPTVELGSDRTAGEGEAVSFSATVADEGTGDTLTYAWSFGDTGTSSLVAPSHSYVDDGNFQVTLTVTDDDGGSASDSIHVVVSNVAPEVEVGSNQVVNEGTAVQFAATASDDGTADALTYHWSYGDGTARNETVLNPSYTYQNDGVYTVTLTVSDGDGGSTQDTLTVTVNNVAPTAEAGLNQSGVEGQVFSFTGTANDANPNDSLSYLWNFGDGSTSTLLAPTHAFPDNASYTVTFTVYDDDTSTSDTLTVTTTNVAPVIEAGTNRTVNEGTAVDFHATATDAGSADVLTISWAFGDGGTASGTLNPVHAYADNGSYTVTLTVTDDDGASVQDTLTVTVNNVAPAPIPGTNITVVEGISIPFNGVIGDPGTGDTFTTISWTFGDGATATSTLTPTHAYADEGSYTVRLTVTDDDGATGFGEMTVTVTNAAPIVQSMSDVTAPEGSVVNFSGNYSDTGTVDTHTYLWDFGDGATNSTTLTPSHIYADNGTYQVTLTVTDNDGSVGVGSMTVTVTNVAPDVDAGSNVILYVGGTVNFVGDYDDPAGTADEPYTFIWTFGDGSTNTTSLTPSHVYSNPGVYTVRLTVTDKDGGVGYDEITVDVSKYFRFIPIARAN